MSTKVSRLEQDTAVVFGRINLGLNYWGFPVRINVGNNYWGFPVLAGLAGVRHFSCLNNAKRNWVVDLHV